MSQISKLFMSPNIEKRVYEVFINSVKNTTSQDEVVDFLGDLLSPTEKVMLAKRLSIAFMILEGKYTYEDIAKTLKVSRGTIARVHTVLNLRGTGYRKILGDMLKKKALKILFEEMLEGLTPLPPKGTNWGEWKKRRREAEWKREEPL